MTQICKLQLHIKSFDNKFFNSITETLKRLSIDKRDYAVVQLPTNKKRFTVLRSPHIDKKSRDQFEMRVYKRIYVLNKAFTIKGIKRFIRKSKQILPAGLGINYVCNIKNI